MNHELRPPRNSISRRRDAGASPGVFGLRVRIARESVAARSSRTPFCDRTATVFMWAVSLVESMEGTREGISTWPVDHMPTGRHATSPIPEQSTRPLAAHRERGRPGCCDLPLSANCRDRTTGGCHGNGTNCTTRSTALASVYALLKGKAELKGRSVLAIVVNAAKDAAQRAIEDDGIIRLLAEDQARFAQALVNPRATNAALKRIMRRHVKNVDVR